MSDINQSSPSPSEPIIFIDWDDTLYPTSWFRSSGDAPSPRSLAPVFEKIEKTVKAFLSVAQAVGKTYIVTSASATWVEDCLSSFLPGLRDSSPEIIPANYYRDRTREKKMDFREMMIFRKHQAMMSVVKDETSFISIGDSHVEQYALHRIPGIRKSVKLKHKPSLEELCEQLENLTTTLPLLVNYRSSIDLEISNASVHSQFVAIDKLLNI